MLSLRKRFDIMVTATLRKNLASPMPREKDDSCLQEDQELLATCTFVPCPIDVVNKQLFSPLS